MKIPFDELRLTLERALNRLGITGDVATLSARLIAETDLDGVSTHGIARFPLFARMIRDGHITPAATPTLTGSIGALERWNGNLGPGNLAAHAAMSRAMDLAREHGLGGVALANTVHWQRGGTYGWQAANAGFAAICWTNTLANLPPWGATTPALGNNPLVIAIPRKLDSGASAPLVLDMAMTQFSYGTLAKYRLRNEQLPFVGGYDTAGDLTADPAAIGSSRRALPIGYWKGSGLSLVLDVLGAMLADGRATHQIPANFNRETGISQIFLAMSPDTLHSSSLNQIADGAIAALHAAEPENPGHPARYPGEHVLEIRAENLKLGVPVNKATWTEVQQLAF